jgi:hypothetical protein
MTSIKDKNLLFYSVHPKDEHSKIFLSELKKNPQLERQFILVCVSDPKIKIPPKIHQLGKIPILIASGLNQPIFGEQAISWLKNNNFQEKGNGYEYGTLGDDMSKYALLGDESKLSGYQQSFNQDYNRGFSEKDGYLNQQFANITAVDGDSHISTYEDPNEKKDAGKDLDAKLSQYRQQRELDVPKPIRREGAMDNFTQRNDGGNGGNGGNGGSGSVPSYNPNPFGQHNVQGQGQGHQLPFNTRLPMSQSGGSLPFNTGPTLPFNMGGSRPYRL